MCCLRSLHFCMLRKFQWYTYILLVATETRRRIACMRAPRPKIPQLPEPESEPEPSATMDEMPPPEFWE
uniref:Uncharacterized protein n=1 Tax=viral metagenome TaxID=1070528 RepID=A0A6C0KB72_9ZZZZ